MQRHVVLVATMPHYFQMFVEHPWQHLLRSFNIDSFIILAALGLSSSMQDLLFWLMGLVAPWHVRS